MSDAVSEDPGLARPGPGDHENGAFGGGYRLSLAGVEVGEERGVGREIVEKPLCLHRETMVPVAGDGNHTRVIS